MQCPLCKAELAPDATSCAHCTAAVGAGGATITQFEAGNTTMTQVPGVRHAVTRGAVSSELTVGSLLADRYEILQVLGEGGMGAVYKARDNEVDRVVAIKVIRPELANKREILDRFKQELILARQITHKNVIRIFDVGSASGVRFITMEFVEGRDLHSILAGTDNLSLAQKVKLILQVCDALDAAHAVGVVHRDLKPQNIMVESSGRAVVMDFGIARSMEQAGATSTGTIIGTPSYMSPEQAKGDKADMRSDLFSLGIIFYELLTNKKPYVSDTIVGLLLKRIQERPVPPVECDGTIPRALNDIVLKCMAVDLTERYQSATELSRDLRGWLEQGLEPTIQASIKMPMAVDLGAATVFATKAVAEPVRSKSRMWLTGAAVGVLAMASTVYILRDRFTPPPPKAPPQPVTVMIAEFTNRTGEPVFDGTLEPVFKLAIEGAGFISAYDRTQIRSLGAKLDKPEDRLDEPTARRIAINQGLSVVVVGSLARVGGGYTLTVKASQAVTGNIVAQAESKAASKEQVLAAVTSAAGAVRRAVGDATESDAAQRFGMEALSATSLEAVHEYAMAMEAVSNGKYSQALGGFAKAAELDPNFGIAYTGMSVASRTLGRYEDAEKYVKKALQHVDKMTERERYRTRGHYYLLIGDNNKCVEEYAALIQRYPADITAINNLALCSTHLRQMTRAVAEMKKAVTILPKRLIYRVNLALYSSYSGDFAAGEQESLSAQKLNASLPQGFMALAFSHLGRGDAAAAKTVYENLEQTGAAGSSFATAGLGDLAVYEGRYSDAVRILESGARTDLADNAREHAAEKYAAIAHVYSLRAQKAQASAAAEKALANSKAVKIRFLAARAFASAGNTDKAKALAAGLGSELQAEPQAYAKLIDADLALLAGETRKAIQLMNEANRLVDTWIGHFDLGRAYIEAKAYTEADSEFDRCLRRRGEALSLFLDEIPSFGYFPFVYYSLGAAREGQKSAGFAESYKNYVAIRGKSSEDPLLAEARRRAGN